MGDNKKGHRLKRKSEAYFDSVAKNREVIPEPAKCYFHVLERLRAFEGGQLADIGCGTGEMLSRLLRELPGRFVLHGLDLSSESLKQAANVCGEGDAGPGRCGASPLSGRIHGSPSLHAQLPPLSPS